MTMTLTTLKHQVRFPPSDGRLSQDEEWCEVIVDGEARWLRFHDYGEIYAIPGLYEHLFYERLKCQSPGVVGDLLADAVEAAGQDTAAPRVLDLGAGNGIMGEALSKRGFEDIVGVDISPEAGEAAERDRPGLYAGYHVCDLLSPPGDVRRDLERTRFGAMTSVAALGFGDVPPEVFETACGFVEDGGWIAFTISRTSSTRPTRAGSRSCSPTCSRPTASTSAAGAATSTGSTATASRCTTWRSWASSDRRDLERPGPLRRGDLDDVAGPRAHQRLADR